MHEKWTLKRTSIRILKREMKLNGFLSFSRKKLTRYLFLCKHPRNVNSMVRRREKNTDWTVTNNQVESSWIDNFRVVSPSRHEIWFESQYEISEREFPYHTQETNGKLLIKFKNKFHAERFLFTELSTARHITMRNSWENYYLTTSKLENCSTWEDLK